MARPRILIVDDDALVLTSLRALLSRHGHDISVVDCGLEAVRELSTNRFDLIILDMMMPDITGHEVMDYINERHLTLDVIIHSGTDDIDAAIGALKRGAYAFLRKSCPREEFLKTIDNALQARRMKQENQRISHQLDNSKKIYHHLVDSSPDIIYTLDGDGCFTFINERALPLLGWRPEDVLGQHYSLLIDASDLERAHYVLNQSAGMHRITRNVELHLKSREHEGETRLFRHEIMHISLPADESDSTAHAGAPRRGIYGIAHDLTERKRTDALIAYQAYHDILTELPNRNLFKDRLELAMLQARRNQTAVALLLIDLDRFKLINDTLGHEVGDDLLRETAARLQTNMRPCDTLSRVGGDEFTIILPEIDSTQDATQIAARCLASMRLPFMLAGQTLHVTASIGIAMHPQHGQNADDLLKNADIAMYHQKSNGKDGYAFFDAQSQSPTTQNMTLEHDLHEALENNELEMYYQPQINVETQKITGAEALMRWNHPRRGRLGAGEFLPYAEENGLILPMTDWMLESVCKDLQAWNAIDGSSQRMSINLSPHYLDRGHFVEKLKDALERYKLPAAQFEIEITENICIRNPLGVIDQLNQLCQLGVSIAIDDFGTGYSSLSYLHRFPIHTLKIDRSFVMEILDEATPLPIVMAIISIAKGLNLHLVAEGVENENQNRFLAQAGCQTIQGYYYHKPMQQAALLALLQAQSKS